jgi:hypothetical protein
MPVLVYRWFFWRAWAEKPGAQHPGLLWHRTRSASACSA